MRAGYKIVILLIATTLFCACKKDASLEPQLPKQASLEVNFIAKVGEHILQQDKFNYTNFKKDSFSVTMFNYYISNVKLRRSDGFLYEEKESYHLIQHVGGKTSFILKDLPEGEYTYLEFLIGVDSLRNISGAQTNDLDPVKGMFWDWDFGYVFFKMEGTYNTSGQSVKSDYAIHIGGSEKFSCLQKCAFNLNNALTAKQESNSRLTLSAQIEEVFNNPFEMDFSTYYNSIGEQTFNKISENYKHMFAVDKIEN